jgi:hypothetical protein
MIAVIVTKVNTIKSGRGSNNGQAIRRGEWLFLFITKSLLEVAICDFK